MRKARHTFLAVLVTCLPLLAFPQKNILDAVRLTTPIVFDGKEHPVDSKDIAFQTAGREAFKQAFKAANPVLLEPIYTVEVTVPDEYMGDVMGDFNTRRGRVLGMEQRGNRSVIRASVPLAEIMRYSTDLRSMTQGRGLYTIEFDRYEPVPSHLAQDIIAQHKEEAAED